MSNSTSAPAQDARPFLYLHHAYFRSPTIMCLSARETRVHLHLITTYCDHARRGALTAEDLAEHPTRAINRLQKAGLIFEDMGTPGEYHLDPWIDGCEMFRRGPSPHARPPIPGHVRQYVYERDGHRCLHCGTTEDLSLDHIYPWSLGGSDDPENLQTLCRPCNSRKGARVVQ